VKKGDKVLQGQVIALVGSTGVSTAPHLHFSVVIDGVAVDPLFYIRY
jgi:murein DD-endopeptidase MepM/ murein hydrolase activator NlpD